MKKDGNGKVRIGVGLLLLLSFTVLIALIIKEFTAPLSTPKAIDVVAAAPPKTEPPTPETKTNHSVPETHPKYLVIPKLSINTNVYTVGITREGAIDAPQTAWDVGWYKDGALPGSGSGAALIDGHVNDAYNTPGVFYKLAELTIGDEITIIRGDNSEIRYKVASVTEEPLSGIDMRKVLSSAEPGKEGLNLITCGGKYDQAARTYTNRVIVYSVRV